MIGGQMPYSNRLFMIVRILQIALIILKLVRKLEEYEFKSMLNRILCNP